VGGFTYATRPAHITPDRPGQWWLGLLTILSAHSSQSPRASPFEPSSSPLPSQVTAKKKRFSSSHTLHARLSYYVRPTIRIRRIRLSASSLHDPSVDPLSAPCGTRSTCGTWQCSLAAQPEQSIVSAFRTACLFAIVWLKKKETRCLINPQKT